MILGHIDCPPQTVRDDPRLAEALEHIRALAAAAPATGRHDIHPERLFINCDEDEGRTRAGARLEFHRHYIDVQLVLTGTEVIGWKPIDRCTDLDEAYDKERDAGFYSDEPEAWVELTSGTFVVLFPEDAHAPLAGEGVTRKLIGKVRVDGSD